MNSVSCIACSAGHATAKSFRPGVGNIDEATRTEPNHVHEFVDGLIFYECTTCTTYSRPGRGCSCGAIERSSL